MSESNGFDSTPDSRENSTSDLGEDSTPDAGEGQAQHAPETPVEIDDWQRLSRRSLIVNAGRSVRVLAIPLLFALFGFGSGFDVWGLGFAALALVLAAIGVILTWLTTRYRVDDIQLQTRKGLIFKSSSTVRLDRVRSVDLEAELLSRILGVTKVEVGTGVDADKITLDALTVAKAKELQRYLMDRAAIARAAKAAPTASEPGAESVDADFIGPLQQASKRRQEGETPDGLDGQSTDLDTASLEPAEAIVETELARFQTSWLRFAPFSLASLVVVAAVGGIASQAIGQIEIDIDTSTVEDTGQRLMEQSLTLAIVLGVLLLVVAWLLLSTITYVVRWYGLRLVRSSTGTIRLTRGLFTTKSTTVEESKVRGVIMSQPALLRVVRGAELSTIATGVGEGGTVATLPPSPRSTVLSVGAEVLARETMEGQGSASQDITALEVPTRGHGFAAARRLHIQSQWATVFFGVPALIVAPRLPLPDWYAPVVESAWYYPVVISAVVVIAMWSAFIAFLTHRVRGNALTEQHLVSKTGALAIKREVLERTGVIGWVIGQSFFQRRNGLCDLTATTAAGSEKVIIRDVPFDRAVEIARTVTPEPFARF